MPKLSDTQAVLLAGAAARPDLTVLPAPGTLKLKGAALERSLQALLRSDATEAQRLALDLRYTREASVWVDLKIMGLTVARLSGKGSN